MPQAGLASLVHESSWRMENQRGMESSRTPDPRFWTASLGHLSQFLLEVSGSLLTASSCYPFPQQWKHQHCPHWMSSLSWPSVSGKYGPETWKTQTKLWEAPARSGIPPWHAWHIKGTRDPSEVPNAWGDICLVPFLILLGMCWDFLQAAAAGTGAVAAPREAQREKSQPCKAGVKPR